MKGISTLNKKDADKNSKKDGMGPSTMTLNFLSQFARCYYVDRQMAILQKNDYVLN